MARFDDDRRQGFYAVARWTAEDIPVHREYVGLEKWTDTQANEWLDINQTKIQDAMIPAGWDAIATLMEEGEETEL